MTAIHLWELCIEVKGDSRGGERSSLLLFIMLLLVVVDVVVVVLNSMITKKDIHGIHGTPLSYQDQNVTLCRLTAM